jgi:hypothetical protein
MPIATLSFTLPDEATEHRCAVCGPKYRTMLEEVAQAARALVKYETGATAEQLKDQIWEIYNSYHFDPWDEDC